MNGGDSVRLKMVIAKITQPVHGGGGGGGGTGVAGGLVNKVSVNGLELDVMEACSSSSSTSEDHYEAIDDGYEGKAKDASKKSSSTGKTKR